MSEPRTTYEWYDEPVVCCSRCHFVQIDGEEQHAGWCDRDEAEDDRSWELTQDLTKLPY
jgi:hypothetical protein